MFGPFGELGKGIVESGHFCVVALETLFLSEAVFAAGRCTCCGGDGCCYFLAGGYIRDWDGGKGIGIVHLVYVAFIHDCLVGVVCLDCGVFDSSIKSETMCLKKKMVLNFERPVEAKQKRGEGKKVKNIVSQSCRIKVCASGMNIM